MISRSGYLPRFLGVLLALGGLAFITRNFLLVVLTPAYAPGSLLLLMALGGLALAVWLLKGRERAAMEGGDQRSGRVMNQSK